VLCPADVSTPVVYDEEVISWPVATAPLSRIWLRAEYLLWWVEDGNVPPLVTTSPQAALGVLGEPGTRVLFGGSDGGFDYGTRSGGRFSALFWLDPCQTCGVEGVFFFLGQGSADFAAASAGDPVLARPFVNPLLGAQDAELVANLAQPDLPDLLPLAGRVTVSSRSRLWGAEANGRANLCRGCTYRVDLLGGFRYLSLDEGFTVAEDLRIPDDAVVFAGSRLSLFDSFGTRNDFYGGQLGTQAEVIMGRFGLELTAKVGLGSVHQRAHITGGTRLEEPGAAVVRAPGGLLALPTNIGSYSRNEFAVVPEVGVNLGFWLSNNLIARVGYNFLYWSDVARPGDQVDLGVNPTQLPPGTLVGPARPSFRFHDADFWAHGVNFALEFRY
jgi:hypothetical protein